MGIDREFFTDLVNAVKSAPAYTPTATDRISEDGKSIVCTVCGKTRKILEDSQIFGDWWRPVEGGCDCDKARAEEERQRNIREDFMRFWDGEAFRKLLGRRYADVTFDKLVDIKDKSWQDARTACVDYANAIDICVNRGLGFYLYSPQAGTGKTTLLACIRNQLIEKQVKCIFISCLDLMDVASRDGKETQETLPTWDGLKEVPVLIVDDIGAEDLSKSATRGSWANKYLLELFKTRHDNFLSTLFSSNYTVRELQDVRGYDFRLCDRISGLSTKCFKIDGASIRGEKWELGR